MSSVGLETPEFEPLSVSCALCLLGEHQHLLGAGSVHIATNLRVRVKVTECEDEFSLSVGGSAPEGEGEAEGGAAEELEGPVPADAGGAVLDPVAGRLPWPDPTPVSQFVARWEKALSGDILNEPELVAGLNIEVDFGPLWYICPPQVLLMSPALAVGLAVAGTSLRGQAPAYAELAELARRLRAEVVAQDGADATRCYNDALMGITGGAAYVERGADLLNVQQLLPPESFILALASGVGPEDGADEHCRVVRQALRKLGEAGRCVSGTGDEADLSRVFELCGDVLDERETAMLYGLMRARQMVDSLLEDLVGPFVDNDRLAEVCDEESAILADYFGFPAEPYDRVRAAAAEAGALGAKLTW
ncbi:MAG: hypothetical protein KAX44_09320, partial [Candidatus Brocadiae bacterium]|nr:hypothetical protein [Candidatus Brocadiia bacterium]